MQYKNVFEDFFYSTTATTLTYRIEDENGEPVFVGRAVGDSAGTRVNVAQKIRDWLFNEIGDFRELDGEFFDHPDAIHAFSLVDMSDSEVKEQWMVIYSFQPWNGDTLFLTTAINTHASPLQKLFVTNGAKIDVPTHRTQEITDGGEGDGPGGSDTPPGPEPPGPEPPGPEPPGPTPDYFYPGNGRVGNEGGDIFIPISTSYDMNDVEVVLPSGVTLVDKAQSGITVYFPANTGIDVVVWTIEYYLDGEHLGTSTVLQDSVYSEQYLTYELLSSASLTPMNAQYSVNGGAWTDPTGNQIQFQAGDKIRFRGHVAVSELSYGGEDVTLFYEQSSVHATVYGNILSVVYSDNFIFKEQVLESHARGGGMLNNLFSHQNITDAGGLILPLEIKAKHAFNNLFTNCSSLTVPPRLPATKLSEGCYRSMFFACRAMTTPPQLPATVMKNACYENMFCNCHGLTSWPDLPATTLAYQCYYSMFASNFAVTTAPQLPATSLAVECYRDMFFNCTHLVNAPALPATTLEESCYQAMFQNCDRLVTAPVLPALTLATNSYRWMFSECPKLYTVRVYAKYNVDGNTDGWLEDSGKSGCTAQVSRDYTWARTNDGIPSNWTIVSQY